MFGIHCQNRTITNPMYFSRIDICNEHQATRFEFNYLFIQLHSQPLT